MIRALLFLALIFASSAISAAPITPAKKRAAVEDFSLKDLAGKTHKISNYRGKVVVISLWATWCKPCIRELKYLKTLKALNPNKLEILAIATDGPNTAARIRPVSKRSKLTMPVLLDSDGAVMGALNSRGILPHSTYIDAKGKVAYAHSGFVAGDEVIIKDVVTTLLKEK